ncbi:ABZJ_00895 family protein [Shewanella corallii]|uniref:ABZJ_00895 family protein n=1 Tax=Shewanella corallii TaxID=560080 RepID=A0ABT0NB23_9GAMM|nr:ABZJ_00895 family protein [Shewanella corallii]MCL2915636.1 ABZJ_00895 family protein [Shewanella corallii]
MTMMGFWGRFTLIYVGLSALVMVLLYLTEIEGNSGVSAGIMVGSIFWAYSNFYNKSGRLFTPSEVWLAVLGVITTQVLLSWMGLLLMGYAQGLEITATMLLLALGLGVLIYGLGSYIFIRFIGGSIVKQAEKAAQQKR